ncbi:hypothetical protein LTR95_007139 [Oleoguttula sp. CCFEE 5521]
MSTFNGVVKEFSSIRIDQFRSSLDPASTPPLAFFLSHVHSDHLAGLESCKSPFIYCSPATKEILLRLEKYPHRMNFAKGILETRKQTYKHLRKLLKAIPLDTPTQIDLTPDHSLRVTLLDANHCVGAVMFLIEGNGKAILYTGDIRSEIWWVNALTRHPILIPYARFNGKKLIKQLDYFVRITPIISRHNGTEIAELGAGGGQGDLDQQHELEVFDLAQLGALMKLCTDQLHGQPKAMKSVMRLVASLIEDPRQTIALDFAALLEVHMETTAEGGLGVDADELSLSSLVPALVRLAAKQEGEQLEKAAPFTPKGSKRRADHLPNRITFPYSRHSSYTELCHLLEVFKPTDVHPCTVDDTHWGREQSMTFLFGHLYDSVCNFTHDRVMLRRQRNQKPDKRKVAAVREGSEDDASDDDRGHLPDDEVDHEVLDAASGTAPMLTSSHSEIAAPSSPSPALPTSLHRLFGHQSTSEKPAHSLTAPATQLQAEMTKALASTFPAKEHTPKRRRLNYDSSTPGTLAANAPTGDSTPTPRRSMSPAAITSARKQEAHDAALEGDWDDITLVSVSGYHQEIEVELGDGEHFVSAETSSMKW